MKVQDKVKTRKPFYRTRWFGFSTVSLIIIVVVAYTVICSYAAGILTTTSNRNLGPDTPASFGMNYENITFKTPDKAQMTIDGWWIPREGSDKVLIMVHSKDGTRTFLLPISQRLWQEGFNILMYDTRGQGKSGGDHYTFGWNEKYDVIGAVNYLKTKGFSPDKIGAVGWSMGAATVLLAMAETPDIQAGLVESSYGSLDRVISEVHYPRTGLPGFLYPGIKLAGKLLYDLDVDQSNPEKAITKLGDRKVFLIHAGNDEEIPVKEFEILVKAGSNNVADSWLVPGVEHVRSFKNFPDEYTRRAANFFNNHLK